MTDDGDSLGSFLSSRLDEEDDQDDSDGLGSFLESKTKESEQDRKSTTGQVEYSPRIYFSSSESMDEVGDEEVELIVTSPPYNVGWEYGSHDDMVDYADEYMPMLASVFEECYRVLRPGGRMVINVPDLVRQGAAGGIPIASHIVTMLDEETCPFEFSTPPRQSEITSMKINTDWVLRETVVWNKGFNDDGLAPNGSFPRPWGILLNNMYESVLVFQKPGDRSYDDMPEEVIEQSKINKTADDMCDDVWDISPESWSFKHIEGEDVPVFPEELVRRCIQLWTYVGDTVLDPFAGRFTVGKVAKEEKRESIGYEIREELEKDIKEYTGMEQAGLGVFT